MQCSFCIQEELLEFFLKDIFARPSTLIKYDSIRPIRGSKTPPYHGALSTLNCHLMPLILGNCLLPSCFQVFLNHLVVDLKVWALSDIIRDGIPRLVMSDFKFCLNVVTYISVTGSI